MNSLVIQAARSYLDDESISSFNSAVIRSCSEYLESDESLSFNSALFEALGQYIGSEARDSLNGRIKQACEKYLLYSYANTIPVGIDTLIREALKAFLEEQDFRAIADGGMLLNAAKDALNFQDSAETTPAGAGDPVGGVLPDGSSPAALRFTSATTERPLRGRHPRTGVRNLLDRSQDFDNAYWSKSATTFASGTLTETSSTSAHGIFVATGLALGTGQHRFTFRVQYDSVRYIAIGFWDSAGSAAGGFDLVDGVVTGTGSAGTGWSASDATISEVSPGVFDCSVTVTGGTGTRFPALLHRTAAYTAGTIVDSYAGDTGRRTGLVRAQLELGSTATAYQNRVSINDVTEAGVPDVWFYRPDGTDDKLEGNAASLDILKGAPGVTFVCAFRPASIAGQQHIFVTSTDASATATRFLVSVQATTGRLSCGYRREAGDGGTTSVATSGGSVVAETKVLTVMGDFVNGGEDALVLRENSQVVGTFEIAGTGNFDDTASLRAHIGASLGSTNFTNGELRGLIFLAPRVLSASELAFVEAQVAKFAGVSL